eukprot:1339400-Rhodomonas_salina.4
MIASFKIPLRGGKSPVNLSPPPSLPPSSIEFQLWLFVVHRSSSTLPNSSVSWAAGTPGFYGGYVSTAHDILKCLAECCVVSTADGSNALVLWGALAVCCDVASAKISPQN